MTAEEKLPHAGVREDRAGGGFDARAAQLEDHAEIRDLERALGVLLDHQDRDAFCAQVLQDAEGLLHQQRRQPDRRLVDQHELRLEQQAARDLEQLLLAARQRGGLRAGLASKHGEALHQRFDAPGDVRVPSRRGRAKLQIVQHAQLREHVASLRHIGNPELEQPPRVEVGDLAAVEHDAAALHPEQAEQRLENGGLAGAVRPDHRRDGAARDFEARAVEHGLLAVAADDVLEGKNVSFQDRLRSPCGRCGSLPARPRR